MGYTGRIVRELGDDDDLAVCVAVCVSLDATVESAKTETRATSCMA